MPSQEYKWYSDEITGLDPLHFTSRTITYYMDR